MAGHGAAKIKSAGAFRFVCLEFDVMREVSADITLLERLGPALRGLLFWDASVGDLDQQMTNRQSGAHRENKRQDPGAEAHIFNVQMIARQSPAVREYGQIHGATNGLITAGWSAPYARPRAQRRLEEAT
jgi:hypothetical protein